MILLFGGTITVLLGCTTISLFGGTTTLTSFGRAPPPPLLELHAKIASMLRATKIGMILLGFIGHLGFAMSNIKGVKF